MWSRILPSGQNKLARKLFTFHRLNIGPRLTLCFVFIILAMLVGNAVLLWQFQQVRAQAELLSGVDQKLIAVLQAHTNLISFYERLDVLAHAENTGRLVSEVEALHNALLENNRRGMSALSRLPPEAQRDPTLLPTLNAIQDALPAHLEAITDLAKSRDWAAVRLRLANQVRPLESRSSALVGNVDREVGEERAQAVLNIEQAQRRILLIVPLTAVLTLLFAALLGLAVTRSITQPLGRLMEAAKALGRGEFQHRVAISGEDEFTLLGRAFNDTAGRLRDLYATLQASEDRLRLVINTIPAHVWSALPDGSVDFVSERWMESTGRSVEDGLGWDWGAAVHPDDLARLARLRRADGEYRWWLIRNVPLRDELGNIVKWYGTSVDIEDRKRSEERVRQNERELRQLIEVLPQHVIVLEPDGSLLYANQVAVEYTGLILDESAANEYVARIFHPDDLERVLDERGRAISRGVQWEAEARVRRKDGEYRWFLIRISPLRDEQGRIIRWYGTRTDIEDLKQAEDALRRSEGYLSEAQRLTHSGSWAWNVNTQDVFWSQEMFRIFDYQPGKVKPTMSCFLERVHPEDRPLLEQRAKIESTQKESGYSESDYRIVLPNGTIRRLHSIAHPVVNESGEITEVVGTTMDVTEQHEARTALETAFEQINALKDQLHKENIALREEIDRSSMFEEIVGESRALQAVLTRVAKVAPTDSIVLITGETGTGKELIARAIHKRSQRAARAFVSVNCAAIPPSLIASELFGHEKGAFTGAIQRRLGRFELAEEGTIFLDEVGELPPETQIALLRVLQEHEFQRVGGAKALRANVRVIAATNRDLQAGIDAGTFRSDLYYRLNVFPIEMPPLRGRREDIPLLVQYFIDRYSSKTGKRIRSIHKATLEMFKSYSWPGNIRELQNVIERSIIVCETENFTVDESWLYRRLEEADPSSRPLLKMTPSQEREAIEAALAESGGRVSGPLGAAAKLGVPGSTLDSKIKALKINKHRFKDPLHRR